MGVTWTKKQQEVIDSRGCSLLVSAAAGSGKTAVLVQHILSRITDAEHPIDVDRLCIVTFTKAAAAEMKERIGHGLDDLLEKDPENVYLQKQRALLNHAHISTIDSFCMWIVKNHFHQLDLDPDFRIGDEGELRLLRVNVLDEMMEDRYQKLTPEFANLVEGYAGEKSDDSLRDLILKLYDFAQSAPWPEQWLKQCRNRFGREADVLEDLPFVEELLLECKRELWNYHHMLEQVIEEIAADESFNPAYETTFLLDLRILEELLAAETFTDFVECLDGVKFSRKPAKKRGQEPTPEDEYCSNVREVVKEAVNGMKKHYDLGTPEQMLEAIQQTHDPMNTLLDLALDFGSAFERAKKEKNLADFADVEHMALSLLLDASVPEKQAALAEGDPSEIAAFRTPLADELSRRFEEIIIDEYQDSNLVQELILSAISREYKGEYNKFQVGDVKQSIYKFRMARPELFMEKYKKYSYEAGAPEQKINLSKNFRSRKGVLESTNHLFYQLMGENLGGIRYNDLTALYPAADYPEPKDPVQADSYGTEVLMITGDFEAADNKEWEAKVIADRIRELVSPQTGMRLWDAKKGEYRTASYKDIVILLRAIEGWAEEFAGLLMREGIPAIAQQKTGYFAAREVQLILNLLKIIDNPRQDIPLMSVLVSPIGEFTDEEIAEIMAVERKRPEWLDEDHELYMACCRSQNPKMQRFLDCLEDYRAKAVDLSIHELLEYILEQTGYALYLSALPAGENRRANIEMLREMALKFEQTSFHGIFQFNRYIEEIRKYDIDYGEASVLSENDDLVRITSIHKSKGLEYPIVFLAGMGKGFNLMDARRSVVLHEDLGLASDYIDLEHRMKRPTLWKRYVADRMVRDIKGEELRVLYVAMTRAREKLILTGMRKPSMDKWSDLIHLLNLRERLLPDWFVSEAGSYMDWLLMGLARDEGNFSVRDMTAGTIMEEEMLRQAEYRARRASLEEMSESRVWDAECREAWKAWMNYQYPHEEAIRLRGTVSVSELKAMHMEEMALSEGEDEDAEKMVPGGEMAYIGESAGSELSTAGDEEDAEYSRKQYDAPLGAERGTAYHALMERIPPEEGTDPEIVRDYLEGLQEDGVISPEVAERIWVEDITRFWEGPLGQRIREAAKENKYHTEQPFVMGIPACQLKEEYTSEELVLIQGIIDVYFEEPDGLVLLDYKTDRIRPGEEQTLIDRYKIQLDYYRTALEKTTGKAVKEGWLYSFRLHEEIRVF